jgi:hypothetical protein
MFAYCLNNPVCLIDPLGNTPINPFIWFIKKKLEEAHDALKAIMEANFKNNSAIDNDSSTTTRNKLINDQNGLTGSSFKYGLYPASWNACETIAVHNAKVLLGIESTLSQTMMDFQCAGAMIGDGYFGSNPFAIGGVLENSGISYTNVGVSDMTQAGTYIISVWNENPPENGLHTIAISYDGTTYSAYNLKCNGSIREINPADYTSFYICGYYLG